MFSPPAAVRPCPVPVKIPGIQDTDDIIQILSVNRIAGQTVFFYQVHDFFFVRILGNCDHIRSRSHHSAHTQIIEIKYILNPFLFVLINTSLFFPDIHQHTDFILCHIFIVALHLAVQQPKHQVGR